METNSLKRLAADPSFLIYQQPDRNRDIGRVAPGGQTTLSGALSLSDDPASQNSATVISFSQDALDRLAAMQSEAGKGISMAGFDRSMTSDEVDRRSEIRSQLIKVKLELSSLNRLEERRDTNAAMLKGIEASYVKMRDTSPKAAVTLNAADTAKALQMLKDAGRTLVIPKDGSYGYVEGGVQYMFRSDGTVTVQEEGVATSTEHQAEALAIMQNWMAQLSGSLTDTSARREALTAERDALLAKSTPLVDA